jgi:chromosome segregation ATPase
VPVGFASLNGGRQKLRHLGTQAHSFNFVTSSFQCRRPVLAGKLLDFLHVGILRMNFFNKSKFKHRENQNVGRSQPDFRQGNVSIANVSSPHPSLQDEHLLVQECLNIIEQQTAEINELKHELNLKGAALDDCLGQADFSCHDIAELNGELQSKTQEIAQLRNQLESLNRLDQEKDRKAGARIKEIESQHRAQISDTTREITQLKNQLELLKQRHRAQTSDTTQKFNRELDKMKTAIAQKAQEATRSKTQLDLESSETARAKQIAEQLAEQLSRKGQQIHEQDAQIQTQTHTIEQTRLSLNRTRNELNQEKQRAARAVQESATKSQQLEFVQQQCAHLQEQLRSRNSGQLVLKLD